MSEEYEDEPVVIELGRTGLIAWVSEEDRELQERYHYKAKSAGTKEIPHYYALRAEKFGQSTIEYYLHNEVWERMMGSKLPRGFLVDHINRDKLDNRRSNLRLATPSDNEANKRKRRTQGDGQPSSKYKGVNKTKTKERPWRAIITVERRQIALGKFADEIDAAKAYNKAALHYYGEFAFINEFDGEE